MRKFFFRLKVFSLLVGVLGAATILSYQCIAWLRLGTWSPLPLDTFIHAVRLVGSNWVGLQVVFDWILSTPSSIVVFSLGLILFWLFDALSPRDEKKWTAPERPVSGPLLELSKLDQKDRIQILMGEYAALRAEIMSRTGFGFQIAAVALAGITWFMAQPDLDKKPWYFWVIMAAVAFCFICATFVNVRDLTRVAHRMKELEYEVNSRAGEHLLVWETLSGVLTQMGLAKSFVSRVETLPRSRLPSLDPSYLQRSDPKAENS